jgi:ubiquinone/menaquinone biosynthesis C-methylase UbiE
MAPARSLRDRHGSEIEHGARIAGGAEDVWGWGSPAGRRRARRRADLLVERSGAAPGRRILELGCGIGVFSELVAESGAQVVGIDISFDLLRRAAARRRASAHVSFERAGIEALPHPGGAFDAVVGSSVLHHLEVDTALREIFRVLRPGGALALAEPNMMNPQVFVTKSVPPIKRWAGDTPDERAFFRWPLARLLKRAGFESIRVEPYDFLHPAVPSALIGPVSRFGEFVERLPLFREFAGSLIISAVRPGPSG